MKNKITELNQLYQPSLEKIEEIRKILFRNCIDHAILFSNNHHIKIGDKIESVKYPIPNIICKLDGIKTKIGIDLATDLNYIGFVKFTLLKEQFNIFKFDVIKHFKFEVYGFYFYQYYGGVEDLDNLKTNVKNSTETTLNIKIKVSSIDEIISIINSLSTILQKRVSVSSYICECGHEVSVNTYYGQCPICGEDSPHRRKFKTKCPVCGFITLKDKFGNGECENCGWEIDVLNEKRKSEVVYPNMVSLNKAKKLYKKGKPFRPDLNDFLEAFNFYGEMQFQYKNIECELIRSNNNGGISFCYEEDKPILFANKEDFIKNAKIGDEYVKDIWDKVDNPKYL